MNTEALYPLSPMQQGMLFETLHAPAPGAYVNQLCLDFEGEADAAAFRATWDTLASRHAVLRTSFVWDDVPEPLQIVEDGVEMPWQEIDWRGLGETEQQERFERFLID